MRSLTVVLGCLTVAATCLAQTPYWRQVAPSRSGRAFHAMAYDSARQRTVFFGGIDSSGQAVGDTWEWDGRNWALLNPATSPSARGAAMVYDSVRQRMVLFGGSGAADTWEWDGKNWTRVFTATSPPARGTHAMAYDSARQRTVLFGGYGSGYLGDTWEYDGTNWTEIKPTNSPPAQSRLAMTYDSVRRRTVLFGGHTFISKSGTTWEWDGRNWVWFKPTPSPAPRSDLALVYDSGRQRTVLFGGLADGGNNVFNDTWEWDGGKWALISSPASPSGRYYTGMAYDSVRQRTVLVGGQTHWSGTKIADTWEYGVAKLTLTADTPTISVANGGIQTLSINAGSDLKNKTYWIFGSITGTMPGIVLTGIHIPLVPDTYTDIAAGAVNTTLLTNFKGTLSTTGRATALLNVPANLPIPTGLKLYHAYLVYDATRFQVFTSSNPVSVEFR